MFIPFPSLVGQAVSEQAVLLTRLLRSFGLPDFSVTSSNLLSLTVAGPCRPFTGLPY